MLTCLLVCGSIYYKKKKKLLASYMRQEVNALIIELFSGTAHGTFISDCYRGGSNLDVFRSVALTGSVEIRGCCMITCCICSCWTRTEVFSTSVTDDVPLADRLFHCLCYPIVIPGCRNTLGVAVSAGAGVCPYSRIAAGRLRGHAAGIAVGMGRLARLARRTGVTGAGLAGGTII